MGNVLNLDAKRAQQRRKATPLLQSRQSNPHLGVEPQDTQTPTRQSNPHLGAKRRSMSSQARTSSLRKFYLSLVLILYCLVNLASAKQDTCDVCDESTHNYWTKICKNPDGCEN